MSYFTQQWSRGQVDWEVEIMAYSDQQIRHTAGNLFRERGVLPGDTVYIISYAHGELRVHARLLVDGIVDQSEAERIFEGEGVWEASDHIIVKPQDSSLFRVAPLTDAEAASFEFISKDGSISGPRINKEGRPEHQSFRAVREITERTAEMLDRCLNRQGVSLADYVAATITDVDEDTLQDIVDAYTPSLWEETAPWVFPVFVLATCDDPALTYEVVIADEAAWSRHFGDPANHRDSLDVWACDSSGNFDSAADYIGTLGLDTGEPVPMPWKEP